VSITAELNSRLLTWSSSGLRQYLTCDSHLSAVFDLIIGSDIAAILHSAKFRSAAASVVAGVPAIRQSLPFQLNVGDDHRSVYAVRPRPGRPEQLPLKALLPSALGKLFYTSV